MLQETKQQRHGKLAKAIRKKEQPSLKKGKQERKYTPEDFQAMATEVLRTGASAATVAQDAGFSSARSSLYRYVREIRGAAALQHDTPEATIAAQIAFSETLELKQKIGFSVRGAQRNLWEMRCEQTSKVVLTHV